jgi:hypothetical protein
MAYLKAWRSVFSRDDLAVDGRPIPVAEQASGDPAAVEVDDRHPVRS